jgi:hypothetical protein
MSKLTKVKSMRIVNFELIDDCQNSKRYYVDKIDNKVYEINYSLYQNMIKLTNEFRDLVKTNLKEQKDE